MISAWIWSKNIGDEAIFISLIDAVRKEIPKSKITVFSRDLEDVNVLKTKVGQIPMSFFKHPFVTVREISKCDVFVCGGGGVLEEKIGMFHAPFHLFRVIIALLFKKPVMFYSVGAGPINNWFIKFLIWYVVKKAI